jgi:uncharacterized protein (DUF2249 family)
VADHQRPCEVRNLLKHSSKFYLQSWQLYRIKDIQKGPEVWKIKHLTVWRRTSEPAEHTSDSDHRCERAHRRNEILSGQRRGR